MLTAIDTILIVTTERYYQHLESKKGILANYTKTDSSFQAEQWSFSPSGLGEARLTKEISPYPKRYTKVSLIPNGNRMASLTKETYFQDSEY